MIEVAKKHGPSGGGAVLYTFRRCPYAMRARMALAAGEANPEVREVVLRDKPDAMLAAGTRGTVPLLVLPDRIIEQSVGVMDWALAASDPRGWLRDRESDRLNALLGTNDGRFKHAVDRYKYPQRYPEHERPNARDTALGALGALEAALAQRPFLGGEALAFFDAAIFPFVRQFAAVDPPWFSSLPLPNVRRWRNAIASHLAFMRVMKKLAPWKPGDSPVSFVDTLDSSAGGA